MWRFVLGFILGCAVMAIVGLLVVLPNVRENGQAVGINDGSIAARSEIARKIPSALGSDVTRADREQESLFDVKASSVVVVERNGVKTLRVLE